MSEANDPRVLFASERTMLAWNRTSISLMAFGFVVERFGLFLQIMGREEATVFERHISFIVGVSFILIAVFASFNSIFQHYRVVKTIPSYNIPTGYKPATGMLVNALIGLLGIVLSIYLGLGFI